MSFCLIICSLFSFTGCSVVSVNSSKINKEEVLVVGNTTLTRSDIINSFYTYYQNNSSYFSYYDEETIEDSFYTWAIIKQIIKDKASEALYDPETNPNGFIIYTEKDAEEVMESTFEYIYTQISSYETAIYELAGVAEDDYPTWLKEDEEEEGDTSFESYKSSIPEVETKLKADYKEKLTDDEVKTYVDELKTYLFEYVSKKAEDEDEKDVRSAIDETASKNYIVGARNSAYAKYIEGLVSNAKSSGSDTDEEQLLLNELVRVYKAYYESKLTTLLQEYYLEDYLLDTVNGDTESLSDKAVVEAYLEAYLTDLQVYQVEDSYIATMTSSDGASLVLYNYAGKNYFFSVQHILVAYDDYMTETISNLTGYTSGDYDFDSVINDNYIQERDALTKAYTMLTTINEDAVEQFKQSITVLGNYYYFDEAFEGDSDNYYGYIPLNLTEVNDEKVYTRIDTNEEVDEDDVQFLATETDIINCYNSTLNNWCNLISEYIAGNDSNREDMIENHEDMDYVFETALNIYNNGVSNGLSDTEINSQIREKTASLLFVELQWIYSTDSLGNELSNKIGYMVSNYPDENGSWVVDFAVGARKIMVDIEDGKTSAVGTANVVTSNYGYHIIKIENIYTPGESLVDMSKLTKEIDINDPEFVEEMAELLKQTYVCTSSNQTLYDYYLESLYSEYVGTSESSGTYFVQYQYQWLAEYLDADKVEYLTKLSYDDLMDAIA